jgi:hypothetical protein
MTELTWIAEAREVNEGCFDLLAFAEEHDLAIGEAREILEEAGCDRSAADRIANRQKKW